MTTTESAIFSAAASQLSGRPDEEHFSSLADWRADAERSRSIGQELGAATAGIFFREMDDGSVGMSAGDALPRVSLSAWACEQAARTARIPLDVLARLDAREAASVLNWLWRRQDRDRSEKPVSDRLLLIEPSADPIAPLMARAITSQRYERVWDADVLDQVDRWLLAAGMEPTVPTLYTEGAKRSASGDLMPALFRGDRSSFAFFSQPKRDDGSGPSDEFGGLRRGFFFGNSEVGFSSLSAADFLFRDMCANFLIWGAENAKAYRARHAGNARQLMKETLVPRLREISSDLQDDELRVIQRAAESALAGDGSPTDENKQAAAAKLRRIGITKKLAEKAVEASLLPQNASLEPKRQPALSYWTVANGLSWEAKELRHCDERVQIQEAAGQLIEKAPKRARAIAGA